MQRRLIRRALVSVYDKAGLDELGAALVKAGVEVVSTGSTAKKLTQAGVTVTEVAKITGFPECLGGRVKTLHPGIHAGILADTRLDNHLRQLEELKISTFDLVVSNLYPFADTVASRANFDECIEQIDIGGPTMVRAAAKNHASVAVVTSPSQYPQLVKALAEGGFTLDERRRLAATAFAHTASYDVAVANWLLVQDQQDQLAPAWLGATWSQVSALRYGENSHQRAALYRNDANLGGLATAVQLHGKPMSYNNYVDADAAWRAANDFVAPAVAVIKHTNPCGIAIGADIAQAHRKAHATDPVSAFGGVIAANTEVSLAMAEQVSEIFTEVIVAPGYAAGALEVLSARKGIRVLVCDSKPRTGLEFHPISGGLLVQDQDVIENAGDDFTNWQLVAGQPVSEADAAELVFAWRACRSVKSNAILLARDQAAVGIGMGQVNRVDSCRLAIDRAGQRASGSVAASDAFFPFPDGPQLLIDAGVRAIVQPGGSIRDEETIEICKNAGVTMYFTGTRHFFH